MSSEMNMWLELLKDVLPIGVAIAAIVANYKLSANNNEQNLNNAKISQVYDKKTIALQEAWGYITEVRERFLKVTLALDSPYNVSNNYEKARKEWNSKRIRTEKNNAANGIKELTFHFKPTEEHLITDLVLLKGELEQALLSHRKSMLYYSKPGNYQVIFKFLYKLKWVLSFDVTNLVEFKRIVPSKKQFEYEENEKYTQNFEELRLCNSPSFSELYKLSRSIRNCFQEYFMNNILVTFQEELDIEGFQERFNKGKEDL